MSPFQIEYGIQDLRELHPLKEKVEWHHINSCFCCCKRKKVKSTREEGADLIDGAGREDHYYQNEEDGEPDDPFLTAGFGVDAYFNILSAITKMFFWVTIFMLPVFYVYSKGTYLTKDDGVLGKTFLGNLGGAHMVCD